MDFCIVKSPLSSLLKNSDYLLIIRNVVSRSHHLVSLVYLFLKLYLLHLSNNDFIFPHLNVTFINLIFRIVAIPITRGRPPNQDTKDKFAPLLLFYNEHFLPLIKDFPKPSLNHINSISLYESETILTSITNNIKSHYFHHLFRFVNLTFVPKHKLSLLSSVEKKILFQETKLIKNDLLSLPNVSFTSNSKYHSWLHFHKSKLILINLHMIKILFLMIFKFIL